MCGFIQQSGRKVRVFVKKQRVFANELVLRIKKLYSI